MRIRAWLFWLLLMVAVGACAAQSGDQPLSTNSDSIVTRPSERTTTSTSLAPPSGADVVVSTNADGFDEVEEALADAVERWHSEGPETYGYRVVVECGECLDQSDTIWVRRFDPDSSDDMAWDVDEIYRRIRDAIEGLPERIEVAFDPDLGIPVWFAVEGDESEAFLVEMYHEIAYVATPFDGSWRFVGGELDGREFANPATGLIVFSLQDGYMGFPIDCNWGGAPVDIYDSFFGAGGIGTTEAGCPEYSEEAELFRRAVEHAAIIEKRDSRLTLSSKDSVLAFVRLEEPERRGELPRTAAGETLLIDADGEGLAATFTISPGSGGDDYPGRTVQYTLTGMGPGSEQDPTWRPWDGEFEVPQAPSGPVEVVMPDDIGVGDYQLCSPYWSGDFFCYDLLVRPASAPWYVTAGAEGVVLHDADGTSETVWGEAARVAFWFEDLMVVEPESGPVLTVAASGATSELVPVGSRLLDAARVGDSNQALVLTNGQTVLVGIDSGGDTDLGGEVLEGRVAGEVVILRTSPTQIEARSGVDGSTQWKLAVDESEMISSVNASELRLDSGRLNTDGSALSFWQYLDSRIVDVVTGAVTDEFSRELAIPLEGDGVTEPCRRAELRDGLMLCLQADGRFMTIRVEGGDQLTVPGLRDVIATYVRSESVP